MPAIIRFKCSLTGTAADNCNTIGREVEYNKIQKKQTHEFTKKWNEQICEFKIDKKSSLTYR